MWKLFSRRKKRAPADESVAELRDKFHLETHGYHGFPLGPSSMTFDPYRRLLYIGTNSGEIRMVGTPGVRLSGNLDDMGKINQILPFTSEPALITVCGGNMMYRWCLEQGERQDAPELVLDRSYKFQGGLNHLSMDTQFDGMSPEVLSWSRARAVLGYKGKDIPGEVRTLDISPRNPKQLLIGYEHGYFELWDALTWKPLLILGPFRDSGDTLAVAWNGDGERFVSSHQDGTIAYWNLDSPEGPVSTRRLHDGRCQDIVRILWPRDNMLVMSGGASLDKIDGDSVTVAVDDELYTMQLTSPVRGMHVLEDVHTDRDSGIVNSGSDCVTTTTMRDILVLLLEQEILFIELSPPEFPLVPPPYLISPHNSPMKLVTLSSRVSREVWQSLSQIGRVQRETVYRASTKKWPVNGGKLRSRAHDRRDVLLTGHEDGTVKFWDISNPNMNLLYTVNCSMFFSSEDALNTDFFTEDSTERTDPTNIKQMGFWDPRSDDDQLTVTSLDFQEELLAVGLHGGATLIFSLSSQSSVIDMKLVRVSIMRDDPRQRSRNWQAPLTLRTGGVECPPGYHPSHCIHLFPNVSTTTLAIAKDQRLIAVGCVYGFTVVDFLKGDIIHIQSTFDSSSPDPTQMSRMQSIRRSFRQSLKRLNVRHSMRGAQSTQRSYRPSNFVRSGSARPSVAKSRRGGGGGAGTMTPPPKRDFVKTMAFTAPCHLAGHSSWYGLLVGTNCGRLLTYTIDMPAPKHREARSPIVMPVEHNFNVKKDETVLFAGVIDAQSYLLDVNDEGSFRSARGTQYLTVCTEEGIKSALLIMDSEGYISVYTLPDLKLICRDDCVDATDAVGQRNFACSSVGVILHQRSPSEFARESLTEEGRLEVGFSVPLKTVTPLVLTPQTPKHELVDQLPTPLDIKVSTAFL
ncbi:LLGL scribble cell polarity complex component 2 [Geodia barretti]|uniref:LLGL scribble cell polarity complex component 2 n=1 Tax=Geodia barretti TaxID=519541 RepID=A0AA35XBH8_GEOBA|nr:LLGL scribble cell polarity complex component 2 [Geodia barretti]